MKHRLNALAPVLSLPTEVIAAIFSFLRFPGTSQLSRKPDHHLAWLYVAHVCHLLRVDLPLFWSQVDFANLTFAGAAEILARAKNAPLHLQARGLDCHWNDAGFSGFEKELQAHVSYISHLTISADSRLRETFGGLVSPAPSVEYFSLTHPGSPWLRVFVSDKLFDGTTPRLSSLELYNYNISWTSPLLKSRASGSRCTL